jgi:hypothetical protein
LRFFGVRFPDPTALAGKALKTLVNTCTVGPRTARFVAHRPDRRRRDAQDGPGENIWSNVHIDDLVDLYIELSHQFRQAHSILPRMERTR